MDELFKSIKVELNKSKSKLNSFNSKNINGYADKLRIFKIELSRLNKTVCDLTNEYGRKNNPNESDIAEIKSFINTSVTEFIKTSGTP